MPTDFFPTDLMDESGEFIDSEARRLSHDNRVEFLKGYIRNEKLADLVVSLDEAVDHWDADFNRDKMFFMKQAHVSDLAWVSQQVKSALIHCQEEDPVREKLQALASKLDSRIVEVGE